MKKLSKSLLLVACLITMTLPTWGQTSTQGKEFWVSLIPSRSPDGTSLTDNGFSPYLAISAPKACKVTISNPNTGWSVVKNIPTDNAWAEIKDIPNTEWFGSSIPAAETVLNTGLKIVATEEVSVFCALLWSKSFDATNVLPISALQSDYIVQTYGPSEKDGVKQNEFTILAAENCTVDITPSAQTEGGKTSPFTVTLKAGQVYHVKSAENKNLSGSRVVARDSKKIAVFAGCPLTNVPGVFADRDLLYEQLFPIDYWGQNFIVSRSKQKDANRIIITAQEDATQVTIYGNYDLSAAKTADHTIQKNYTFTLDAGQSYEFEMSAGYENGRWDSKRESFTGVTIIDSCAYIKTSCPCAVLSYDVGNGYYRKDDGIETQGSGKNHLGAPAMTWVSPIEQMINDIVFGVMGTNSTHKHFINIIANTSDVTNVKLNNVSLASQFRLVESNPSYSYARITLRETTSDGTNPFYHLQSKYGFIATVYGNGDDESYAYSVGSSAVKRGVNVEGVKFINDMIAEEPFCINSTLHFDPQVNTDIIDKVVWDFGDGTSTTTLRADGIVAEHTYTSPGWFDVTALISAHKDCPYSSYPEKAVSFSFRVVKPDTIRGDIIDSCISLADYKANPAYWDNIIANPVITYSEPEHCYDDVLRNYVMYHRETEEVRDTIKGKDVAYGYNGIKYTVSQDVVDTIRNSGDTCYHFIRYYVKVISCLDISVANNPAAQHACLGENITVTYTKTKGDIDGKAILKVPGYADQEVDISNDTVTNADLVIPTGHITEPGTYKAQLLIKDENCGDTKTFDIDFTIYYPADIFTYEFNNVLAVWQKGYGGNVNPGWDFTAYQWYRNGTPIDGATSSVYHTAEPFTKNDEYYVELTRRDGLTLRSCSQTIIFVDDFTKPEQEEVEPSSDTQQAPSAMPAKLIRNQQMLILHDGEEYNMFGQRVR